MNYREYIQSDQWQLKRLTRIKKDGGKRKCFMCQTYGPTDIHHKTYERLGAEHMSDLVQLCRNCHDIVHAYCKITGGRVNLEYRKLSKAWIAHADSCRLFGLRKRNPDKFALLADAFFRKRLSGHTEPKVLPPKPDKRKKPCKLKPTPFQQRVCGLVAMGYGVTADTPQKEVELEELLKFGRIRRSENIKGVYVAHSAVMLRGIK